jgi:chemotaxis-related protein WspB
MLFLLFQLGKDRYALETGQIEAVLPLLNIKQIPQAPAGVAGVFNYHGAPVPVIDLSQLALNRPAQQRLSTRIILVHYPDQAGWPHLLGLIAEYVAQTIRREPGDFSSTGLDHDGAPYLGPVASDAHGLIQWIELHKLLPTSVRDVLFRPAVEN